MTGTNNLLDQITFCCPACRAKLTVPVQLAGIEGPCPSCYQQIRAPELPSTAGPVSFLPPVLPSPAASQPAAPLPVKEANELLYPPQPSLTASDEAFWDNAPPAAPPLFPPRQPAAVTSGDIPEAISSPAFDHGNFGQTSTQGKENGFKARLAIRPPDELDASWKDRHRDQEKSRRRVRRAERAAQNFLDSATFRFTRAALNVLSGGMLTWLFLHMKDNQWNLPGMGNPVAGQSAQPKVPPLKNQPPGHQETPLPGDDDAEIPPASNSIPRNPASSPGGTNIAAPPR